MHVFLVEDQVLEVRRGVLAVDGFQIECDIQPRTCHLSAIVWTSPQSTPGFSEMPVYTREPGFWEIPWSLVVVELKFENSREVRLGLAKCAA